MSLTNLFSTNSKHRKKGDNPFFSMFQQQKQSLSGHHPLRSTAIYLFLFIIVLIVLRVTWIHIAIPNQAVVHVVNGTADLSHIPLDQLDRISLRGEWLFYPNVTAADVQTENHPALIMNIPGNIYKQFERNSINFATYRLQVLLPEHSSEELRLFIPDLYTSGDVFVNGEQIASQGTFSTQSIYTNFKISPFGGNFTPTTNQLDIVIQVSVHESSSNFGILKPVMLGEARSLTTLQQSSIVFEFIAMIFFISHAIYALILIIFNPKKIELFCFVIFCLVSVVSLGLDDSRILTTYFDIPYEWKNRIFGAAYCIGGTSVYVCLLGLLNQLKKGFLFYFVTISSLVLVITHLYLPYSLFKNIIYFSYMLMIFQYLSVLIAIFKAISRKTIGSRILLAVAVILINNLIWGFAKNSMELYIPFYPLDILICFITFTLYWFYLFWDSNRRNQSLATELMQANQMKDQFLASSSHELRNPLQGILSITQTSLENYDTDNDEQKKKHLALTVTISKRMSKIIDHLMDFTRLKNNAIHLSIGPINIHSIVSGVFDMLRYLSDTKGITLKIDIADQMKLVMGDEERIIQVMFNLIHNAIKFTDHGIILVRISEHEKLAKIEIIDSGIGMDEETSQRIFYPYEQGEQQQDIEGIGLGLVICDQLLKLHESKLQVHSELGKGSCFYFTLNISLQKDSFISLVPDEEVHPNTLVDIAGNSILTTDEQANEWKNSLHSNEIINILLVDDDHFNLKILKTILTATNYKIETALNGDEALEKLDNKRWHLIISDVMMPNMSGYELTKLIRTRYSRSELPILLLTARSEPEDIFTGFISGANDYVRKPLDALELRVRVHALTEMQRSAIQQSRIEAAWLQAQIKPHFLFNTLNSISALSDIDTTRMRDMLEAFSSYLRLSYNINNTNTVIELEQELELVQAYLYIEKQRFEERLTIVWNIDSDMGRVLIPPLSIQPLVENALKHGILKRVAGGTVIISIQTIDDHIHFTVEDDGVGMDSETLAHLNKMQASRSGGIGVLNTNRRIKHMFGEGLRIESQLKIGTKVNFRISK